MAATEKSVQLGPKAPEARPQTQKKTPGRETPRSRSRGEDGANLLQVMDRVESCAGAGGGQDDSEDGTRK